MNFLIDESVNCSKGSVGVISYLHYFFEHYGLGETHVHLHCDNCSGQNKNNYVMWYLAWRVMRGLHQEISCHFMPAGHTKFSPDWCFGLLKRRYRRAKVDCLDDICRVVRDSTRDSGINIPQLVGREDGSVEVPTYDWQPYLSRAFKPLKNILKFFHFRVTADQKGTIFYKSSLAEEEQQMDFCKRDIFDRLEPMPRQLPAPGLSRERQQYLYNAIRPYVADAHKDTVCPQP